jgi:ADP-heptose:LPS heptosyltransferase
VYFASVVVASGGGRDKKGDMASQNILFLAPDSRLDAFNATGVLNALIKREPEAHITIVCHPNYVQFYENAPAKVSFLAFDDLSKWRQRAQLASLLLGRVYHRIVALGDSRLPYFLWAKHRHIFTFQPDAYRLPDLHQPEINNPATLWGNDRRHLPLPETLAADAPLIVVAPGEAGRAQWGGKLYAELAWRLATAHESYSTAHMVVLANSDERDPQVSAIVEAIEKNIPPGQRSVLTDLAFSKKIALLQRARVMVGTDRLYARMAVQAGTPIVVRFDASGQAPANCPYNLYGGTQATDLASFLAEEFAKAATDDGLSAKS